MGVNQLATALAQDNIAALLQDFLFYQLHPDAISTAMDTLPDVSELRVSVHPSAVAVFHAPSDLCGTQGLSSERIRAVSSWQGGAGRYDCIFVVTDESMPGMLGLDVAQVGAFLSFGHGSQVYNCALVSWFSRLGEAPDEATRMWMLEAAYRDDDESQRYCSVISMDSVVRAAHLMPIFGNSNYLPRGLTPNHTLTTMFRGWYVNKFIDHHAFELAF